MSTLPNRIFKKTRIPSVADTYVIKTGPGTLHSISIGATRPQAVTVYDGVDTTGAVIFVGKGSVLEQTFIFDCLFNTGLTVVTTGLNDVTVTWI